MTTKKKTALSSVVRGAWASYNKHVNTLVEINRQDGFQSPWTNRETISYETGTGRHVMRNCVHTKSQFDWIGLNTYAYSSANYDIVYENCGFAGPFLAVDSSTYEPDIFALGSFSARAFQAMEPNFQGDISVTNFLLELVDIKRLIKLGLKWKGMLYNFKQTTAYLNKLPHLQTAKVLLKEVANGHLSLAFGIKPFLRDVIGMYSEISTLSDRIADFLEKRGTDQARHYHEVLFDGGGNADTINHSANLVQEVDYTSKTDAWATMYYRYQCPDITEMGQMVDIIRDSLGLRFGLAQIWEAIPFSFVVDWFVKVQDFLEQFNKPLFGVDLTVVDYCITHKTQTRVVNSMTSSGNRLGQSGTNTIAVAEYKKYARRRQAPNSGASFVTLGHYGLNQLALSASLAMGLTRVQR